MAAACVSDDHADMAPPLAVTGISPGSGALGCVLGDVLGARGVRSTVRSEYSAARSEYPTARSVHFLGPLAPGRRGPLGIVAGTRTAEISGSVYWYTLLRQRHSLHARKCSLLRLRHSLQAQR